MSKKRKKEHLLWDKLLYSFCIIMVYLIGQNIPLYGVERASGQENTINAQTVLLQSLTGDSKNTSIFILGLWPYMMSSMIVTVTVAFLSLDRSRKISPKKINHVTLFGAILITVIEVALRLEEFSYRTSGSALLLVKGIVCAQLITGMFIVIYLCDRMAKHGIGGRTTIFLVNMIGSVMTMFTGLPIKELVLPCVMGVLGIVLMLVLEMTEKRILVQRVSINNLHAEKNYIAYKLNPVGVMPLMFSSVVFLLPQFLCSVLEEIFPKQDAIRWFAENMTLTKPLGIAVYMGIVVALTISFSFLILTPEAAAEDLLKAGDSILNIYAGKQTKRYLKRCVLSFSLISAIVLAVCQGGTLFLQFKGYLSEQVVMLPCTMMMLTGMWIAIYREAVVYRDRDRYKPFV